MGMVRDFAEGVAEFALWGICTLLEIKGDAEADRVNGTGNRRKERWADELEQNEDEADRLRERLSDIPCVRSESIRGYSIVRKIGRVESGIFKSPASAGVQLKALAKGQGGNAVLNYWWEKKEEDFRIHDGYGHRGRPHFHTEWIHYFEASGLAVEVKRIERRGTKAQEEARQKRRTTPSRLEPASSLKRRKEDV